jgi:hypothetical protein
MTKIFVDDQLAIQEGTSLSSVGPFSVKQKMSKYQVQPCLYLHGFQHSV